MFLKKVRGNIAGHNAWTPIGLIYRSFEWQYIAAELTEQRIGGLKLGNKESKTMI